MAALEVPLSPKPQSFTISLGATKYRLSFNWNPEATCWVLDIYSDLRVPILLGVPVVTGLDLLRQYAYLGFTGALIVQTDHSPYAVPTYYNLGDTAHVFFVEA